MGLWTVQTEAMKKAAVSSNWFLLSPIPSSVCLFFIFILFLCNLPGGGCLRPREKHW